MTASTAPVYRCPHCGTKNRVPASGTGTPRCGHCHRPLPWLADAGDETFGEIVEKSPVPVVVDLWATWCAPCRMVSPALEQVAAERAGSLKLVKVDVDQNPALSRRFAVQAVPTLMVFNRGTMVGRQAGAAPAAALRDWLDASLKSTKVSGTP